MPYSAQVYKHKARGREMTRCNVSHSLGFRPFSLSRHEKYPPSNTSLLEGRRIYGNLAIITQVHQTPSYMTCPANESYTKSSKWQISQGSLACLALSSSFQFSFQQLEDNEETQRAVALDLYCNFLQFLSSLPAIIRAVFPACCEP